MTNNPLQMKIAAPYANALFDFSNEQNVMHKVTADFQNLEIFLKQSPELLEFLNNPLVTIKSKNTIGKHQKLSHLKRKTERQFTLVCTNQKWKTRTKRQSFLYTVLVICKMLIIIGAHIIENTCFIIC